MIRQLLRLFFKYVWPKIPYHRTVMDYAAQQFIAGKNREDAIRVGRKLCEEGFGVLFNFIGDHTDSVESRNRAYEEYEWLIGKISEYQIDGGISLKASSLGLFRESFDFGDSRRLFDELMRHAAASGVPAWLDGEELSLKKKTNEIIQNAQPILRLGKVLQAYDTRVFEELSDIFLHEDRSYRFRICRGAYDEPIELADREESLIRVRMNDLVSSLLGTRHFVQVATHHRKTIQYITDYMISTRNLDKKSFEFALLLGYDMELARELLHGGYRVVIYVPYGEDVEGYCIRRIIERPNYIFLPIRKIAKSCVDFCRFGR